jgi:hypothetical protein
MYLMMWLCPVVFMLVNLQKLISNCGFPDHNWCCSREDGQRTILVQEAIGEKA